MVLSGIENLTWAASFVADCVLLAVLVLRRRAASFPVFTLLIAFYVVRTVTLYLLTLRFGVWSWPYIRTYWPLAFVDELLQLIVFYELAVHVFCPTGVWARDIRRAFVWLLTASGVLALGLAFLASPPTPRTYERFLFRSDFFTSVLMSELFVGTMVLSATAGLPWKTHVARIAQGFGAYALIDVALGAARNYFGLGRGPHVYKALSEATNLAYLGCAGYWIVTLWQDAPVPRELPDSVLMQIYTLQRRVENDLVRIRNWRHW